MARERDNPHRMEAPSRRRLAWLLPALTCLMLLGALILDNQRSGYATGGPSRAGHVDAGRSPSLYSGRPYVAPSRIEAAADAREAGARRHPPPAEGDRDAPALRTSLPAAPGDWSTLQGMLVEADGSPAKDGRIRWVPVQPDGTRMGSDEVKADADGRFSLRARAGERVELEGRSRTSVPTHLERAWPIDGDLGRLTLQPGCTLVGWIQSGGSSRLVGSVSVQPLPASLQSHLAAGIDPGRAPPGAIAPGPLVGGWASVEADGRWQVDGLRPGLYRVMIEDVHIWDERKMPPDVLFESAPLHAALREACARVVEVPGPEVRIPLAASITHVLIDRSAHLHERPDSAMVSATDAEGVTSETKGWFNADWSDELDDSSLTLAAGQPYRLRVWANGFEPLELDHVAGAAGDVVVVPVRLRPVPRSMLRLSAPEQRSQGPGEGMVELRDLAKHERVFWEAFAWKDLRPLELVVPSGAWTLVVRLGARRLHPAGTSTSPTSARCCCGPTKRRR